ncbi:MAG: tRNA (N6-threonylcarbamoyladenosine(37)-N6)-methyltransferase TrmO [Bacteroidales bacterium]|nr:tRNA (N6-threonylcarbamoyladenosine(37)-N6)-methyltransferase TrmO [Bacteroidales bacterium]
MEPIAHIFTDFDSKFGVPRQSNLLSQLTAVVRFEPPYRSPEALRGIEGFDFLWLIWQFSANVGRGWTPTVRPPRMGGNRRMGVFATRSPFRPNALGLSSVRLRAVEWDTPCGPELHVEGADLMNGTPIFDIKPYIPYTDAHPDARAGFAAEPPGVALQVVCPPELSATLAPERWEALQQVLACDPRPAYHADSDRVYGLGFAGHEVRFRVAGTVLTVVSIS